MEEIGFGLTQNGQKKREAERRWEEAKVGSREKLHRRRRGRREGWREKEEMTV